MPAVPLSRASVITFQAPAARSSLIQATHCSGGSSASSGSSSFEPTSESTRKSRANSSMISSLRSRGMSIVPSETSTQVKPVSDSQAR